MGEKLHELIDLEAVWAFTKREVRSVAFRIPFELEILDSATDQWLPELAEQLAADSYSPGTAMLVESPKAPGLVRPIALMSLRDRVVYNAAVHACYDAIFSELSWAQGTTDFAYRLAPPEKAPPWFKNAFQGWNSFRRASLTNLQAYPTVAMTDVAAFYENIAIGRLISDLQAISCPDHAIHVLSRCLNRWCQVDGRGIPQDAFASHVLAKLYLHPLDRRLEHQQLAHARYSDDLRIFCPSNEAAQRALLQAARTLRRRGLSLQAAKTQVVSGAEARNIIEGRTRTINRIRREWRQAILDAINEGEDAPYLADDEIDRLIRDDPSRIPLAVIRNAFDRFMSERAKHGFDKSVFHFLLNRMADAGDPHALPQLSPLLATLPQETSFILRYVRRVGGEDDFEPGLLEFLRTQQGSVYEAQRLMILAWWSESGAPASEDAVALAREVAFAGGASLMMKATARAVLATRAEVADLELMEDEYERSHDMLEKAQIVCCLRRMERSRLKAFIGRVRGDGDLPLYATAWLARNN